ncbi:MAG: 6-bladed beta-propeller [bacterium]|nr:6-bladed beta-propeller [bacterium]
MKARIITILVAAFALFTVACEDGTVTPTGFIGMWGSTGTGNGEFSSPQAIEAALNGNVYVVDYDTGGNLNDRVQYFTPAGDYLGQWGSTGSADGQFENPHDIAISDDNTVYVVEEYRIQYFTLTGEYLGKWGQKGSLDGEFDTTGGIAVAPTGNIYVSDIRNHRIQYFSPDGAFLGKWGVEGGGPGEFGGMHGLAVSSEGNVYVLDSISEDEYGYTEPYHRVQYFTATGDYIGEFGDHGSGDGEFNTPADVHVSDSGTVFVTDTWNHRVQYFTRDGSFINKWGSYGEEPGSFNVPGNIAISPDGSILYVSDQWNDRIQYFNTP